MRVRIILRCAGELGAGELGAGELGAGELGAVCEASENDG
jgi:hypothetical protein